MNARCTICDAVLSTRAGQHRCPECGARAEFQVATAETPRHAKWIGAGDEHRGWDFSPSGPVLRRMH
jgi:hypothetical protein